MRRVRGCPRNSRRVSATACERSPSRPVRLFDIRRCKPHASSTVRPTESSRRAESRLSRSRLELCRFPRCGFVSECAVGSLCLDRPRCPCCRIRSVGDVVATSRVGGDANVEPGIVKRIVCVATLALPWPLRSSRSQPTIGYRIHPTARIAGR